jgi:hypothetical protein
LLLAQDPLRAAAAGTAGSTREVVSAPAVKTVQKVVDSFTTFAKQGLEESRKKEEEKAKKMADDMIEEAAAAKDITEARAARKELLKEVPKKREYRAKADQGAAENEAANPVQKVVNSFAAFATQGCDEKAKKEAMDMKEAAAGKQKGQAKRPEEEGQAKEPEMDKQQPEPQKNKKKVHTQAHTITLITLSTLIGFHLFWAEMKHNLPAIARMPATPTPTVAVPCACILLLPAAAVTGLFSTSSSTKCDWVMNLAPCSSCSSCSNLHAPCSMLYAPCSLLLALSSF